VGFPDDFISFFVAAQLAMQCRASTGKDAANAAMADGSGPACGRWHTAVTCWHLSCANMRIYTCQHFFQTVGTIYLVFIIGMFQ